MSHIDDIIRNMKYLESGYSDERILAESWLDKAREYWDAATSSQGKVPYRGEFGKELEQMRGRLKASPFRMGYEQVKRSRGDLDRLKHKKKYLNLLYYTIDNQMIDGEEVKDLGLSSYIKDSGLSTNYTDKKGNIIPQKLMQLIESGSMRVVVAIEISNRPLQPLYSFDIPANSGAQKRAYEMVKNDLKQLRKLGSTILGWIRKIDQQLPVLESLRTMISNAKKAATEREVTIVIDDTTYNIAHKHLRTIGTSLKSVSDLYTSGRKILLMHFQAAKTAVKAGVDARKAGATAPVPKTPRPRRDPRTRI